MIENFIEYFHPFVIPFSIGVLVLFVTIFVRYVLWFKRLEICDKKLFCKGLFSIKTIKSFYRIFTESLLHISIFKINPLLGFMHFAFAFGWFMLIVTGWIDTMHLAEGEFTPLYVHIFAKYYYPQPQLGVGAILAFMMDFWLMIILIGLGFALFKRFKSKKLGMKKSTKHTYGDTLAMSALWLIFPARLLAESVTSGIYNSGSFLTYPIGQLLGEFLPLSGMQLPCWWFYSSVLALFFIALPFSRYMHIFTEIPHILLKGYGIKPKEHITSVDNFQIHSCSRCGICVDPCQLQRDLGINDVQSVYFLRDRREGNLTNYVMNNCLMCGRCSVKCPVDIDINSLRLNSRIDKFNRDASNRYGYLVPHLYQPNSTKSKVGYFAGCMTSLTPAIIKSMKKIFAASGDDVWFADENGGVCCGRPIKLSGELDAARKMIEFNKRMFIDNGITTLVTSCPICLKVFNEDYNLEGIEVLHHTQYIEQLINSGVLNVSRVDKLFAYHDPCELGRGSGIYDEPRRVISKIGKLVEPKETRENSLCCGFSLADNHINYVQKQTIAGSSADHLVATGAENIITSCPLCKVAFKNSSSIAVKDISEIVAENLC